MTWVKLDDGFPRHPKVRRLSPVAFTLHVCGLCWCAEYLTDGVILDGQVRDVSDLTPKQAEKGAGELVDRKLWDRIDGGYRIHDFLEYNPSREKVEAERARAAERIARYRAKKAGNAVGNSVGNGVTNALVTPLVTPPPARPDPTPKGLGRVGTGDSRSETRANDPVDNFRRRLSVVPAGCPNPAHDAPLLAGGVCRGCEADRKVAGQ